MLLSLASLTRKQWQDISQQPAHVQGCSYPNQVFSPHSHLNSWSSFTIIFSGYSCIYESFQPKCPFSLDTYLHKKKNSSAPKKLLLGHTFQHRGPCLMAGCQQRQLQQLWTNTLSYFFSPLLASSKALNLSPQYLSTLSSWEKSVYNWTSARRHDISLN